MPTCRAASPAVLHLARVKHPLGLGDLEKDLRQRIRSDQIEFCLFSHVLFSSRGHLSFYEDMIP